MKVWGLLCEGDSVLDERTPVLWVAWSLGGIVAALQLSVTWVKATISVTQPELPSHQEQIAKANSVAAEVI